MSLQDSHKLGNVKIMLVKGTDGTEIANIEKTGTVGLVDTYTITLSDERKYTFTVTNGKSIVSIEKTDTEGLVDTYTITFNDGTTTTFTVTNGKDMSPDVSAIVNVYSSKNILPNKITSQAINGLTITKNSDDSVTINGTASARTSLAINVFNENADLYGKTFTLTGCPSGGGGNIMIEGYRVKGASSFADNVYDTGDGVTFTWGNDGSSAIKPVFSIIINSGFVADNLTFYPMIRDARISDDTYVPYAKTNRELTADLEGELITFTTTTAGVSNIFGKGTKTGRVCNVSFYYEGNVNASTAIGTLSVKPKSNAYVTGTITLSDNSVKVAPFLIDYNGKVYQQGSNAATTNGQFSGTYIC